MVNQDCVFCRIVAKKIPAKIFFEDEKILAFEDIQPEAPIHLLLIPKKHLEWQDNFEETDWEVIACLLKTAKELSLQKKIFEACKLVFNIGKTGHIRHIHLHLLGGWQDKIPMKNL